jgi:hypothetical protein
VPHLSMMCICVSQEKSLIHVAAEACFGSLPKLWLTQLAKHIGLDVGPGLDLSDVLHLLLNSILKVSDERMMEILQKRVHTKAHLDEYLADPEVEDLIEQNDRKDLNEFRDKVEKMEVEKDSVYRTIKKLKAKIAEKHEAKVAGAAKPGAKKKAAVRPLRKPTNIPAGNDVTYAEALTMLPPLWKLLHDDFNARWKVLHVTDLHPSRSRSWGLYGYKESFLHVCRYAWECNMKTDDTPCWVVGLFEKDEAKASAESTAAASSSHT